MNRKQRRALAKQVQKESAQELSNRITQFQSLPEQCLTCEKSFDKSNKKMVKTWNVVVRDEQTVRLYCPECWKLANNIISDWRQEIENVRK